MEFDFEKLSYEEKVAFLKKNHQAMKQGDYSYAKMLPIAPSVAWAAKETWGKDFLLRKGLDLSKAEAVYGKNWLNESTNF